jgi:aspartokinase/homoserine dehydrogenase 1
MKILKFGGKSLANGEALKKTIQIIIDAQKRDEIAVVVSARGNNTNELLKMVEMAALGNDVSNSLQSFIAYQKAALPDLSLDFEYSELFTLLNAIKTIGFSNSSITAKVEAYGELISTKVISAILNKKGVQAQRVDAREIFVTQTNDNSTIDFDTSQNSTIEHWKTIAPKTVAIVTGYIASDLGGNTTTLGRNGSNFSATLLANFLNATEVQNWTNIDGLYTADPSLVRNAIRIQSLTYKEANELAQFGASILHGKTILPLIEKQIPLIIKNSFNPKSAGTVVNSTGLGKGIKAVNVIKDCALISIEGKGLLGTIGIDGRIFSALSNENISVRLIAQASSERSIGFVVNQVDADKSIELLQKEFKSELSTNDVSEISSNDQIAIIAITGRHNFALEKAISGLRKNKIWLHLMTNSINGEHISLVISKKDIVKAVNVVHNQVFGAIKTINVVSLGKGTVGKTLIKQILATSEKLIEKRKLFIKVVGIANSSKFLFKENGVNENWESDLIESKISNGLENILQILAESNLENIVVIDNTANQNIAENYEQIVRSGFDIIASNKIANTLPFSTFENFRNALKQKNRHFFYETNVGAGLPIIDTIKQMVLSDEEITSIKGVFSGSLSYIFNRFSEEDKPFSEILFEAKKQGFTEPDPREDLAGNDVARKLLILAREIGLNNNLEDIEIVNLIPESLREVVTLKDFENQLEVVDRYYADIKARLNDNQVLRYIGELNQNGEMAVKLITVEKGSPLSNLKGADSLIEIYTNSYGEKPIIIQGAGAGAAVTARGVYSDLIRMGAVL